MRRRDLIAMLGTGATMAVSYPVLAQHKRDRPLVAVLGGSAPTYDEGTIGGFREGLRELGYVEGKTVNLAYRFADGRPEDLPRLAKELVSLDPNVIFAAGSTPAAIAAKSATSSIPIVCPALSGEVRLGLVESDARPGGNVTGVAYRVEGMTGKLIELATLAVPGSRKIAYLIAKPEDVPGERREVESASQSLSLKISTIEVRTADEVEKAFKSIALEQLDVIVISNSGFFFGLRRQIIPFAMAARVPVIYGLREFVDLGGLISYGISIRGNGRRAAAYIDKIIKGAAPADLPVEFPTRLELVINLKTAKDLGLTIPPTLLARADDVIE